MTRHLFAVLIYLYICVCVQVVSFCLPQYLHSCILFCLFILLNKNENSQITNIDFLRVHFSKRQSRNICERVCKRESKERERDREREI